MTSNEQSLEGLIERVKAATGPDREIDGRLWCMITPERRFVGMALNGQRWGDFDSSGFNPASGLIAGMVFERTDFKGTREDIQKNGGRLQSFPSSPAYTASIDAALALAERVLPGSMKRVFDNPDDGSVRAEIIHGLVYGKGDHDTWPLAIVLATLLALQSSETRK